MATWQVWVLALSILTAALSIGALIFKAGGWKNSIDTAIGSIKKEIKTLNEKIDNVLSNFVVQKPIRRAGSPLVLTEYGEEISKNSSAKNIVERISKLILDEVRGFEPYEIQAFSEEYMKKRFRPTQDENVIIKRCQYNMGINREMILHDVIALELRDKLLELTNQNIDDIED